MLCSEKEREYGKEVVVFGHGKIAGDPKPFRQLLDRFEKENPCEYESC
jgi:hypothetical protein